MPVLRICTFHDLRGTAVTLLPEADCKPRQSATITGIR